MATKRLKKELEKIQPTSCWGDEPIKAELKIDKINKCHLSFKKAFEN